MGGPGIPEDRIDRRFSPFERLGAEQSEVEGTGLGLALSKRQVEAMEERSGSRPPRPRGRRSSSACPMRRPQRAPSSPPEDTARAPADASRRSRTVLYVEDNLSNLTLVERILSHRPEVQIISAVQGRLGTELATEHRPDLILLDLNFPDISGEEVLRRLKENPRTRGIPVVVISADTARRQIEAMLEAGAHDYISKPLDVPSFLAVVDEILGRG
jgi:CheY-like chemotaxis protein